MTPQLPATIEQLYRAFSNCHPATVEAKPYYTQKLRTLEKREVAEFVYQFDTQIRQQKSQRIPYNLARDFLYFLPKILEIVASFEAIRVSHSYPDFLLLPHRIYRYIRLLHPHKWDEKKLAALQAYLQAAWQALLDSPVQDPGCAWNRSNASYYLASLAAVNDDLSPYLDGWLRPHSLVPMQHLLYFCQQHIPRLCRRDDLGGAYWWKDLHFHAKTIRLWLMAPETIAVLEAAFFEADNSQLAQVISEIISHLEMLHKVRGVSTGIKII